MKILFFYIDENSSSGYSVGLGIAAISGYLKRHEIQTELVYYKTADDYPYAIRKISDFSPSVIGFYSTSSGWPTVKYLSAQLRSFFPRIFQVYGGIHATLVPDVLQNTESLDAVCVGYGEEVLLELCKRIDQGGSFTGITGLWVRTGQLGDDILRTVPSFPKAEPDKFMQFDHELFLAELRRYRDFSSASYPLQIIFNRGCPFRCSFCSNHRLNSVLGNRLFVPSPEASIEAVKQGISETGLGCIEIHDDIFTLNKKWFRRFITQYARDIKLPFICNLRVGTFDEEDVRLLKDANIKIAWIGIESGNDHIRNEIMKKGISRTEILEAFELLRRYEVPFATQNIIGVPHETPEHFLDTIRLNAQLKPTKSFLSVFHPYPGTPLYDMCLADSLIGESHETLKERTDTILHMPNFPSEKIRFYFQHFNTLILYEQNRRNKPENYPLPLTDQNSLEIVKLLG
jgi:radical SAM superfamily enzyme YgiQ (UPF0313 family)